MKIKSSIKVFAIVTLLAFASCSKDNSDDSKFNGSIASIEDFYNPELVKALDSLGFIINTGNKPPLMEGIYLAAPVILQASSVLGDNLGSKFFDYEITFSNQDNGNLTIDFLGDQGIEIDNGSGSFISGEGNSFSIFLITTTEISTYLADSAISLSGTIVEDGIEDLQIAYLMLDNRENEGGVFIPNNTGRVLFDSDNFSEKIQSNTGKTLKKSKENKDLTLLGGNN